MLQTFRDNLKGTVAFILIGLIIIVFALTGVDALFTAQSHTGQAASINGDDISENELRRNIYVRKQQLLQRFQGQIPASMLTDEQLRQPVLDDLVARTVLAQHARSQGMAVATTAIDSLITATPQFQQDGKFSPQTFTQLLQTMGYSPLSYRTELETDIILNQLAAGVIQSAFITDQELDALVSLTHQERDYDYLRLPLSRELESVEVSDEEVTTYYQENQSQYMSREYAIVDYIDLDVDKLVGNFQVTEEEIRQQYEQEMAAFTAKEQRRAAHIMLEGSVDSQKQTIADILSKLAAGESFEALAEQYSADPGSKNTGGDLGFSDGTVFPEAFESALAGLKVGEVSAPVVTDAGIHLIKLLEVAAQDQPTFEQERERLSKAIARAQAENRFVEVMQSLADLTYNADNLSAAAEELGVEITTSAPITRNGDDGLFSDNRVLSAVFSDEVLNSGHNSEVIELSESHVVVLRVNKHMPVRQQTLDEVREQVVADVKRQRGMNALSARATSFSEMLRTGETIESLATKHSLEWQTQPDGKRFGTTADREVVDFVYTLQGAAAAPVIAQHQLENGDYILVNLRAVRSGTIADSAERQQLRARLAQQQGTLAYQNYQELLKSAAEVEIYTP